LKYLVLGGNGGIGLEVTHQLLKDGHSVYASFRRNKPNIEIERASRLTWLNIDLQDSEETKSKLDNLGDVHGLIYCAGVAHAGKIQNVTNEQIKEMFHINLHSAIFVTSLFFQKMVNQRYGRLVFFGSIVGHRGGIGLSAYVATKSGLEGFVRSIHKEIISTKVKFSDLNMTVNLIRPGYVNTKMTENLSMKLKSEIESRSTLGRFLQPTEVSEFVSFLLRPSSNFVSGRFYDLDGGQDL